MLSTYPYFFRACRIGIRASLMEVLTEVKELSVSFWRPGAHSYHYQRKPRAGCSAAGCLTAALGYLLQSRSGAVRAAELAIGANPHAHNGRIHTADSPIGLHFRGPIGHRFKSRHLTTTWSFPSSPPGPIPPTPIAATFHGEGDPLGAETMRGLPPILRLGRTRTAIAGFAAFRPCAGRARGLIFAAKIRRWRFDAHPLPEELGVGRPSGAGVTPEPPPPVG